MNSLPSPPSSRPPTFSQHQKGRHFGHVLLIALELYLESLDLPMVLGAELLRLLLLFQGQVLFFIGLLGGLPPELYLLKVQGPIPEVCAELGGVQTSRLQHHCEFSGSRPAL